MAVKKLKDFTNANNEILVDAAIKDSMGRNIPSTYQEKLTTTSVSNGTIDKVIGFDTNGDIVKATQSSGGTQELFFCTSGTTTFAEITAALSDGKLPICVYSDDRYYIYFSGSSTIHRFASLESDYARYITVTNNNAWSTVSAYNFALVDNTVSLSTAQTITGLKTFTQGIDFGNGATIIKDSSNRILLTYSSNTKLKIGSTETIIANRLGADSDNTQDIGRDSVRWKNLYLSGYFSDGNNANYGLKLPNTSSFSADKTIATTDQFPCNITFSLEANSGTNNGEEIAFTFVGQKSVYENYDVTDMLEIIYSRIFSLYENPFTTSSTTEFFKFSNITKNGAVYTIELLDAQQNVYNYDFDTDQNISYALDFWG